MSTTTTNDIWEGVDAETDFINGGDLLDYMMRAPAHRSVDDMRQLISRMAIERFFTLEKPWYMIPSFRANLNSKVVGVTHINSDVDQSTKTYTMNLLLEFL
ncbi:hypothetical protein GCM10027347_44590 [Larkinella harenae]